MAAAPAVATRAPLTCRLPHTPLLPATAAAATGSSPPDRRPADRMERSMAAGERRAQRVHVPRRGEEWPARLNGRQLGGKLPYKSAQKQGAPPGLNPKAAWLLGLRTFQVSKIPAQSPSCTCKRVAGIEAGLPLAAGDVEMLQLDTNSRICLSSSPFTYLPAGTPPACNCQPAHWRVPPHQHAHSPARKWVAIWFY